MCEKTKTSPTVSQLVHAIRRNFGGLEEAGLNTESVFCEHLQMSPDNDIKNTPRELIRTSLSTKEISWHGYGIAYLCAVRMGIAIPSTAGKIDIFCF